MSSSFAGTGVLMNEASAQTDCMPTSPSTTAAPKKLLVLDLGKDLDEGVKPDTDSVQRCLFGRPVRSISHSKNYLRYSDGVWKDLLRIDGSSPGFIGIPLGSMPRVGASSDPGAPSQ
jgi:hypothetical protein